MNKIRAEISKLQAATQRFSEAFSAIHTFLYAKTGTTAEELLVFNHFLDGLGEEPVYDQCPDVLTLSQALSNSGLVAVLADTLRANLAVMGPWGAMIGIYLGTLLLTETMTNNAAAALAFPVAFGLAESYGVSFMPFVMAVAYGASASFLTPYGYTTNLMVQNLGGYEFRDYFRAGLPLSIVYAAVVILLVPQVFPFQP